MASQVSPEEMVRRILKFARQQGLSPDNIRLVFPPKSGRPGFAIAFDAVAPENFSLTSTEGSVTNKMIRDAYEAFFNPPPEVRDR